MQAVLVAEQVDSPDGESVVAMISSQRFLSEEKAKTFGLDWATAWIDRISEAPGAGVQMTPGTLRN